MSAKSVEVRRQHKAEQEIEQQLALIRIDLRMRGVARRHLDCRVRLVEVLLDQCGGSLLTVAQRVRLGELKRLVALRGYGEERSHG